LALRVDGIIFAWGYDDGGILGDGVVRGRVGVSTPVQVVNVANVVDIAVGQLHSLAVTEDGHVYSWGSNLYGQLGLDTTDTQTTPQRVLDLDNIVSVAAGSYTSYAMDVNGIVYSWGMGRYGQLGDGSTANRYHPQAVDGLDGYEVSSKTYNCLAVQGTTLGFGSNSWNGLGMDTSPETQLSVPTVIDALKDYDIVEAAAGHYYGLVLTADGSILSFGYNNLGQLGNDTTESGTPPGKVLLLDNIIHIAAGRSHSLAMKDDGTFWAFGSNYAGQLGDGSKEDRHVAVQVLNI